VSLCNTVDNFVLSIYRLLIWRMPHAHWHRSYWCFPKCLPDEATLGCVSPRRSCPKFAAADCVRCTNYSAVVPDSPLSAAVSKHGACRCWYGRYQLIFGHLFGFYFIFYLPGTVMENTGTKDYVVAAIMGEGCPGVTTPHFLAVWRSKEVAVHSTRT